MAEAIQKPGGHLAVQMQLIEQFVNELGDILRGANVSVVPAGLANIKGFFEGLSRTGSTMGCAPRRPSRTPGPALPG